MHKNALLEFSYRISLRLIGSFTDLRCKKKLEKNTKNIIFGCLLASSLSRYFCKWNWFTTFSKSTTLSPWAEAIAPQNVIQTANIILSKFGSFKIHTHRDTMPVAHPPIFWVTSDANNAVTHVLVERNNYTVCVVRCVFTVHRSASFSFNVMWSYGPHCVPCICICSYVITTPLHRVPLIGLPNYFLLPKHSLFQKNFSCIK